MTDHAHRHLPSNGNGQGENEEIDWESIRGSPLGEKVEAIANHALDVNQQIGGLMRLFAQAKNYAEQARNEVHDARIEVREVKAAADRCEATSDRCEAILERAFPAHVAPAVPGARRRLESLTAINDDDITAVRDLKAEMRTASADLAAARELKKRDDIAIGVAATNNARLKLLALVLAILVAASTLFGLVWKAIASAHAQQPAITAPATSAATPALP